jgi:hypothetical protein
VQNPTGLKADNLPECIVNTSLWYEKVSGWQELGSRPQAVIIPFLHSLGLPGLQPCVSIFSTWGGLSWTGGYFVTGKNMHLPPAQQCSVLSVPGQGFGHMFPFLLSIFLGVELLEHTVFVELSTEVAPFYIPINNV